ncbi:hypothetical protein CALVIDRAFT_111007 [Calocera viscosa TUFC12733]|uniref:Uncharacterized protein n=1 Tax=Calocera viscosa (strain TUFC12733) TaxID=1330018 RepID=A0A167MHT7_CALVF|nr:hypothetical protein CALVIDRAFT_111007 [Calocera viscosa TUFC12733]
MWALAGHGVESCTSTHRALARPHRALATITPDVPSHAPASSAPHYDHDHALRGQASWGFITLGLFLPISGAPPPAPASPIQPSPMPPLLQRQYATSLPPQSLSLPASSEETCTTLLSIIHDPHLSTYAPARAYRKRFFKRVVDELEARADWPIDECIYETFLSALCTPESSSTPVPVLQVTAPSPAYKTHYYPLPSLPASGHAPGPDPSQSQSPSACNDEPWGRLTVFESPSLVEAGTTGLRTWRASLWLGEWLLDHVGVYLLSLSLCGPGETGAGARLWYWVPGRAGWAAPARRAWET